MPSKEEVAEFMARDFPQNNSIIEALGERRAVIRHQVSHGSLRPGGTVSGPVMMGIADAAVYIALLGEVGIVPLAVTTSLTINFLNKPAADRDLIGICELVKVGRVLVVGEVKIYSDGIDRPVAQASATYSIPPDR